MLAFDARTHKRQQTYDRYGYKSWFALSDVFYSPALTTGDVPVIYTYSAKMNGFEYDILQNTADLQPVKDGKLYEVITQNPDTIYSNDCVLSAALALPILKFNGLYTRSDIEEDLDHQKAVTPALDSRSGYEIWYHVDTDAMMQEGYFAENKDVKPILTTIQLREYKNDEYKDVYTYNLPASISSRSTDGKNQYFKKYS